MDQIDSLEAAAINNQPLTILLSAANLFTSGVSPVRMYSVTVFSFIFTREADFVFSSLNKLGSLPFSNHNELPKL
jgi:hypothetical protein